MLVDCCDRSWRLVSQTHCKRKTSSNKDAIACGLPKRSRVKRGVIERTNVLPCSRVTSETMQEPIEPISPASEPPPPPTESQSEFVAVFLRPDGMLRAGWRLLLYLVMGVALVLGMGFILGSLRHMGITAIWRGFISEATLAFAAF